MNKIVPIQKLKPMKLKDPNKEYEEAKDREMQDSGIRLESAESPKIGMTPNNFRLSFSAPMSDERYQEIQINTPDEPVTPWPDENSRILDPLDSYSDEELSRMSDSEIANIMAQSERTDHGYPSAEEPMVRTSMSDLLEKIHLDSKRNPFYAKKPSRSSSSKVAEDEHKNEIPASFLKEKVVKKRPSYAKSKPQEVKPLVYPENGHYFLGHLFSRRLSLNEDEFLRVCGYQDTIKRFPDLEFIPKEQPINEEEECIVVMSELADCLAIQECEDTIEGFNLKLHNKEYQTAYKKHIKNIERFKRNKNG